MGWSCYAHKTDGSGRSCTNQRTKPPRGNLQKWGQSKDPDYLRHHFEVLFPSAWLSVATGEVSGFIVLDKDMPGKRVNADGVSMSDGPATLARLIATHGPLPETLSAETPSGGEHFLFQWPGWYVKNSVGKIGQVGEVLSGLDIRGDGGQIIGAPSKDRHWKNWGTPIALMPQWLIDEILRVSGGGPDLLMTAKGPRTSRPRAGGGTVLRITPAASPEITAMMREDAGRGVSDAIEDNSDDMWLKVHLALKAIPPDRIAYDDWFAIAAAIYNELGNGRCYGKSAFDLFNEWSAGDKTVCRSERGGFGEPRYTMDGCDDKWSEIRTYRARRPARFGKIHAIALRFDPEQEWRQQYDKLMGRTRS
jgi:hypothetical protein